MRKELFYKPHLLLARLAEIAEQRARLRRLRGTCAQNLTHYHVDSLELIEIAAQAGAKVFYDVGANVGSWALLCRALVPESTIVAFEPLAAHCEKFHAAMSGFDHVRLFEIALGERDESRPLHVTSFSDASSLLPLSAAGADLFSLKTIESVRVPVDSLDHVLSAESLPQPDLIKLDVQGFELEVLKGASAVLERTEWVLAEASFRTFYNGQVLFSELAGFLGRSGFEVHAFGHSMRIGRPLDQVDVLFGRIDRDRR
jgi:FkbM family methyltransferase